MPTHKINESAAGYHAGTTVSVRPLRTLPGGLTEVQVEDCGTALRQGQTLTVPTTEIRPWWWRP
ncbi:hypothetical protein [Streptomyces aidingensis]|uniref:Uncharacterized protein n=1 Tax=Streptomyces aidingensis TaxID=910347 RepID=A0A1I1PVL2_9ACTN|nr:hypothetical protein [Streptomyces aidingensis]SFD13896.1 hypothetical protein SAMN05421773_11082 [Streptomyces aidingensis]